ncbi:hypothetical protein QAD02_013205 [Eretmocerus hayati]|uniref:Uncharacterized protein n=1 Tax=Eretmocerus hayati TaxID=131215 RepID=A0ACC2P2T6_9HYME|nr:hypothetical protein QAD02_013205 [Eretmocerus hayati]
MEQAESERMSSQKCSACQSPLRVDCGASSDEIDEIDEIRYEQIIYCYCQSGDYITDEQQAAHEGVNRPGEKMLESSRDEFPALDEECPVPRFSTKIRSGSIWMSKQSWVQ